MHRDVVLILRGLIILDNTNNRHEIKIESPRRDDRDDDYQEEREKRRPKKKAPKRRDEEQEGPASIYSLLGKKDQPETSQEYVSLSS